MVAVAAVLIGWSAARFALAAISTGCPGNICMNSVAVGAQNVDYSWTQNHNATSSSLKIRFKSGPYTDDANPVTFKITVSKPFTSYATLKNPDPAMSIPPSQTVDLTDLWIERTVPAAADTDGVTYDFVQDLRFESPTPGQIEIKIEIYQYGSYSETCSPGFAPPCASTDPDLSVNLDAAATSNRNEGDALPPAYGAFYKQCADGIDNDLDYRLDCSDSDCVGKTIQSGPLAVCESPEVSCADGFDNDGNGKMDCADPLCNGKVGEYGIFPSPDLYCGSENGGGPTHLNCADGFDNDGNGKYDCADDGPGTGCWHTGFPTGGPSAGECAAAENTDAFCSDNIDNDHDQNYDDAIDAIAATGVDCKDYGCKCVTDECAANRACAIKETDSWDNAPHRGAGDGIGATFVTALAQCGNGADDDLDGNKDCADTDCLAAPGCASAEAYLPPAPLGSGIAPDNPSSYFNFCNDGKDNDGDGQIDGADSDCLRRFGQCTPYGVAGLAATEDIYFLSCADTVDNDLQNGVDCGDAACHAGGSGNQAGDKLGRRGCLTGTCGAVPVYDTLATDAAMCYATENSINFCGDGIDNNGDGDIDCADAGCVGVRHGPQVGSESVPHYFCGAESGGGAGNPNCTDGVDNDSDGDTDCFDSECQGLVAQCATRPPVGWTVTSCLAVPHTSDPAPLPDGTGLTSYAHTDRLHINDPYVIRFTGSGSYSSLTIVLGDAVNPANSFPFNASTCVLSGPSAAQLAYTSSYTTVGTIIEKVGETISGLDATLTCTGSPITIGPPADAYTLSIVANIGGAVQFGESTPSVRVYETTPPTMQNPAVDAEGIVGGTVNIPAGAAVRFQAKPNNDPSGICSCAMDLGGTFVTSPDGYCIVSQTFADDATLSVAASATDGGGNVSATSTPQTVEINVIPSIEVNLTTSGPATYRGGDEISMSVSFRTDGASSFTTPCNAFIYNENWTLAAPLPLTFGAASNLPVIACIGNITVPAGLPAGRYWLIAEATDSPGLDPVRSNVQSFLKCENGDVGTGACKDADFDGDGIPEGRFTPIASYATPTGLGTPAPPTNPDYAPLVDVSACDNCINFSNSSQRDDNANGIGDSCEASAVGRCKYKRCSSTLDPCSDDATCEAAEAGSRCIVVDQAMCTINCSNDSDCSPPTAPETGVCVQDWGLCEDSPDEGSCCFSNSDCAGAGAVCKSLVKPFIETIGGQVYSGADIRALEGPPTPLTNATYCLQASGAVTNFTSQNNCLLAGVQPNVDIPKSENKFTNAFGVIDVDGISGEKYGPVQGLPVFAPTMTLNGGIYKTAADLNLATSVTFMNGVAGARGNGLFVVVGDLNISADIFYQDSNPGDLKQLASVGWIVLKRGDGTGGNITIDPTVKNVVGAFYAEGKIDTGSGADQLMVTGMLIAREFAFSRQYSSRASGAEQVKFDARVLLNPPPGMSDVSRSLPGFKSVPGR